jgi:hypothetical protein
VPVLSWRAAAHDAHDAADYWHGSPISKMFGVRAPDHDRRTHREDRQIEIMLLVAMPFHFKHFHRSIHTRFTVEA